MLNIWKMKSSNTPSINASASQKLSTDSYIRQNSSTTIKNKSKIIGQFSIGEKLGEGTFSKVHLGTHILTQEKVS